MPAFPLRLMAKCGVACAISLAIYQLNDSPIIVDESSEAPWVNGAPSGLDDLVARILNGWPLAHLQTSQAFVNSIDEDAPDVGGESVASFELDESTSNIQVVERPGALAINFLVWSILLLSSVSLSSRFHALSVWSAWMLAQLLLVTTFLCSLAHALFNIHGVEWASWNVARAIFRYPSNTEDAIATFFAFLIAQTSVAATILLAGATAARGIRRLLRFAAAVLLANQAQTVASMLHPLLRSRLARIGGVLPTLAVILFVVVAFHRSAPTRQAIDTIRSHHGGIGYDIDRDELRNRATPSPVQLYLGYTTLSDVILLDVPTWDEELSRSFRDLPRLEKLNLFGVGVTDSALVELARLPILRELSLSGTRVTEAGLSQLANSPSLRRLSLIRDDNELPEIDAASVARLRAAMPNVRIVR